MKYIRGDIIEILVKAIKDLDKARLACYALERGEPVKPGQLNASSYVSNASIGVRDLQEAIEEGFLWAYRDPRAEQH